MKSYGYQPVVMLGGLNKQVGKEVSKDRSGELYCWTTPQKGWKEN